MTKLRQNTVPTSMTNSRVTTPLLDARRVNTDNLVVGTQEVNGVSHNTTDSDPKLLTSSYSLYQAQSKLTNEMSGFINKLDNLQITPVISGELTHSYFAEDSAWIIESGWRYISGQAYYRNDTDRVMDTQAVLRLSQKVFYAPGTYFIRIEIPQITSGSTLYLKDYTGTDVFTKIELPGVYAKEVSVTHPDIYYLEVYLGNVPIGGVCSISRIYIYRIEDRVQQYFNYLAETFVAGDGSGLATTAWVDTQISNAITLLSDNALKTVSDVERLMNSHLSENNPHAISTDMIGAATVNHTHNPTDCGAAPVSHTHTPDQCGAAAVNHTHDPTSIGAAAIKHTHDPVECGAAPTAHTHTFSDLTDFAPLSDHLSNTNNPHNVTKEQIGLDNVLNYPIAEETDYVERKNNRYVTTDGLGNFLEKIFSDDPTLKYSQLAPRKILSQTIALNPYESFVLPLSKQSVYEVFIEVKDTANANYLGMSFTDARLSGVYNNSWSVGRVIDDVPQIGWWSEIADRIYLTPAEVGNNIVKGHLRIDTSMYSIHGQLQSWVGTYDGVATELVTHTVYPITVSGTVEDFSLYTNTTTGNIQFTHDASRLIPEVITPVTMTLIVYELTAVGTRANSIDTVPMLSRVAYLGDTPPSGWMIEDGRTVSRTLLPLLESYIVRNNVTISEEEYTAQIDSVGYCPYFVLGDEYIRLPTMPSSDAGSINIIKIYMSPISGDADIIPEEELIDTTAFDFVSVYNEALQDGSEIVPDDLDLVKMYDTALEDALSDLPITPSHTEG